MPRINNNYRIATDLILSIYSLVPLTLLALPFLGINRNLQRRVENVFIENELALHTIPMCIGSIHFIYDNFYLARMVFEARMPNLPRPNIVNRYELLGKAHHVIARLYDVIRFLLPLSIALVHVLVASATPYCLFPNIARRIQENFRFLFSGQERGRFVDEQPVMAPELQRQYERVEAVDNFEGFFSLRHICPITRSIMRYPTELAIQYRDGNGVLHSTIHTYDGLALRAWLRNHLTDPLTGMELKHGEYTIKTNIQLTEEIQLRVNAVDLRNRDYSSALTFYEPQRVRHGIEGQRQTLTA